MTPTPASSASVSTSGKGSAHASSQAAAQATTATAASSSSCVPSELVSAAADPNDLRIAPEQSPESDVPGSAPAPAHATSSIFSRAADAPVHLVPMRVIRRPLPSELDEDKVQAFMREMEAGDTFTPIEILKVRAPLKSDPRAGPQLFYFSMGGCHRYEATRRLGWESIRARIIEVPPGQMRVYLGAGSPF